MTQTLALLLWTFSALAASPTYHFVQDIPIGGEGGWDWLTVDSPARRLYLTQATRVVVVDLDQNKVVGEITDTPGPHGFAIAADLKRGFSSNGKENKVSVVDLKTLKTIKKVETGENPDAIAYEPKRHEIYAFNGRAKTATVIEAKNGLVITTIALPGKPEFAVVDPVAHRVYANIEDKNAVVAIDSRTHEIAATFPIAPGEGASGLAFDLKHHRLFLGCENKMMVMMDSESGKVLGNVPIGARVDANAFDPATGLAFSSNGEGNVTIAHEDSPDKVTVVQTLETKKGSRTMALDPKTHRIYLAAAEFKTQAGQRPKVVDGTLKLMVYGY